MTRHALWGDRKHWDIWAGRLSLNRWCKVGILHQGKCHGPHPIRITVFRRSESARFDT
jgi:hypothetical protein